MSKDKYPSMFSTQMETIVFIILQIFFATRAALKIKEYLTIGRWGEAKWGIDPWPMRAKGLIVLASPN